MRPTTWKVYAGMVRAHVRPAIGRTQLANVTPPKLNAFYADLLHSGSRGRAPGRPLSLKTARHVHTMLHKALNDAVRWGHLARNPASLAEPPKPQTVEMKVWNAEQLREFLSHCQDHRLYPAWLLLVTTGMRRGEVLGLSWEHVDFNEEHVDFNEARVSVVQTLTVVDYHHVEFS